MKRLLLTLLCAAAAHANVAPAAQVTASTQQTPARHVTDGLIGVENVGEWVCEPQTTSWGYIRYPWVQLTWPAPQTIDKVLLYDRPTESEHTAGGRLVFDDGTALSVTTIPNDGTAKLITFPAKKTRTLRFEVTDGDGAALGLSEIEVFSVPRTPVEYVNPFVETTRGRWFYFTPGSLPFGMIAAAPHTRNKNQWGGGYNYNSTNILGFSQIHDWELSGLEIMPTTGGVDPRKGWKSAFSHDDEIAQPGYQRVYLRDYHTWAELTSTNRTAFYRFRFTRAGAADILVNVGGYLGETTMTEGHITQAGPQELEGDFITTGRYWKGPKRVKVYFVAHFDRPFSQLNGWKSDTPRELTPRNPGESYLDAPTSGVAARYAVQAGDTLGLKLAISYTSLENARRNLDPGWDFDATRQRAQQEWNRWLGKIAVEGGSLRQRTKFYTDLWHALLGRHLIDDASGDYPDYTQNDELKVRTLPAGRHMYSSDALWLTQWNLNTLWGLAWPSVLDDFAASMLTYADNGGLLPRGPCAGAYTCIMTGCPATNLIVSAFMKGQLKKADPLHALEVMKRNHEEGGMMAQGQPAGALAHYVKHGYCPDNAGITLEWAFQDWSLAQMARRLRQPADEYERRSHGWKTLYDGLVFPRKRDGQWLHHDPLSNQGWVEANAWQATWSVSHDIPTLAGLMGGNARLCQKLDSAFRRAAKEDFVYGYGAGYVSYANQPGCSNAHVFNYAGQPWLSQYWVRRVKEQAFGSSAPDAGYGGHDEDQGQMGGLSALMAIGLFSLRGNAVYELTGPVFDRVTLNLDPSYCSGKTFTIRTYEARHPYIQKARLNGRPLDDCWFTHQELAQGGLLELWMGPKPNKNWGVSHAPYDN